MFLMKYVHYHLLIYIESDEFTIILEGKYLLFIKINNKIGITKTRF